MSLFSFMKSPEEKFWIWFRENEDRLFGFEKDRDNVFNALSKELIKIHEDLTFEFGPILSSGKREFVISADGIRAAFPVVENLFSKAPNLDKWIIKKFRPRRNPINDLSIADNEIKANEVHYMLFKDEDPNKVGIMLFFKGYSEEASNIWGQAGYLLLDEALGEYDVETKVGAIVFESTSSEYFENARPLSKLTADFDDHFNY